MKIRKNLAFLMTPILVLLPASISLASTENKSISIRIIGGDAASISDAPWQVALLDRNYGSNDYDAQICGGSILSSTWIITAAHCVSDGTSVSSARDLMVLAGKAELSTTRLNGIAVKQVVVNGEWTGDESAGYDIALIELQKSLSFRSGAIMPINLPNTYAADGQPALITGWGNRITSGYDFPTLLNKATVNTVSHSTCASAYAAESIAILPEMMLCAGTSDFTKDTCQGDSGGPLAMQVDGRWVLQGITSFGIDCALSPFPGVYTEVFQYLNWINSYLVTKPSISSVSPTGGSPGETIQIIGKGFIGTNSVNLSGIEADFTVISDTQIDFEVPAGASSGKIRISNARFNATYKRDFKVIPPPGWPQITKASSTRARVGSIVTISGLNLATTTEISIGGVAQNKISSSSTKLQFAIVPGTATGFISVTNDFGTTTSSISIRIY